LESAGLAELALLAEFPIPSPVELGDKTGVLKFAQVFD
jgi:hypothetical protein